MTVYEVMRMLRPQGGWILVGDSYEGLTFLECEPVTKAELEQGFIDLEAATKKAAQDAENAKKAAEAKLAALGLSVDDLKAIGLG